LTLPPGAGDIRRVGGGDINEAFSVTLAHGTRAFVKTRADPAPGEYAAEAAGLRWLGASSPEAEPGALRTPAVLEVDERYLALEWIGSPSKGGGAAVHALSEDGAEELGRGLAAVHLAGAERFGGQPGAGAERARIGALELPNEPAADWPEFYAERRLRPLIALAAERGALSGAGLATLERVCGRVAELCGPPEPPARLHGDLWSGNVIADAHGRPWLIDPCAYGGHREVDLAMLRLFGSPSPRVLDAYAERSPLADGWRERVELYQLLPLLVHALLFGGSYAGAVEHAARRYA
jgi:fructosamine-3-kinase